MNERRLVQNMQIPEANVAKNAIKQVNKEYSLQYYYYTWSQKNSDWIFTHSRHLTRSIREMILKDRQMQSCKSTLVTTTAEIRRDKKKNINLGYKGIVFQKTCLHFPIATAQTKKQATFRNVIDMLFK